MSVSLVTGHIPIGTSSSSIIVRRTFTLLRSSTGRLRRSFSPPARMSRAHLLSCSNAAEYPSRSHRRSRPVRSAEASHAANVENRLTRRHPPYGLASDEAVHGSRTARELRHDVQQSRQSQHRLTMFVFLSLAVQLIFSVNTQLNNRMCVQQRLRPLIGRERRCCRRSVRLHSTEMEIDSPSVCHLLYRIGARSLQVIRSDSHLSICRPLVSRLQFLRRRAMRARPRGDAFHSMTSR